jgi:serine/threonine protein kinase
MSEPVPPHAAADRNLLFGVLALQMDFVGKEALLKAMNAWVLEKHRPLGKLLMEQGALRPDAHDLLEAMVQKHLELHEGDPARSLASLSPVGSARRDLEQIGDPDLDASLVHVSAAHRPETDFQTTLSYAVGTPTSSGQRFRILRPHAKGGLGEVFVAHDEELHREVALKEIQERHADDPDSRSRFLLEAEITGGLEHPGIVPVYGLGSYADGRPFYAMRFIKGDSLKEAIARFHASDLSGGRKPPESGSGGLRPPLGERTLAFRKLLGRFVDVCQAIQYAHDRGVLHRDLKPGNVMLGPYGETLVVDWGLAKPVGRPEGASASTEGTLRPASASGSAETRMGTALGTPQYMSPEQAAGRLDQLGPASDVYSLGATLYCLLTGRAPFRDAEVGQILKQVQAGDFPRPRQVKTDVPPALEAVCLKAMALRPKERYASPRALADDLEHWLAGEPVSAWPEPWRVRAARWVSRHRTLVSGAAAALLVGLVSLLVATGLLTAANEQLAAERDKVQQANRALETRNAQLAAARAKADKARKRAERSEQQAVAAAKAESKAKNAEAGQRKQAEQVANLLESVFRKLDPRAEQKGLSLKEQMVAQLDALASRLDKNYADQPLVQARLRDALGQAQLGLGETKKAVTLQKQALAGRQKHLPADDPLTLTSMNNLALAYEAAGQLDKALPLFEETLAKYKAKLGLDHPDTLHSMNNLATAYQAAGQLDKALPLFEEALAKSKAKLGPDHPDTLITMNNLARAYQAVGQRAKALPLYEETLAKRKAKLGPDHPDTLITMNNLAMAYYAAGQLDKALPLLEETLAKRKAKLGPDHPRTLTSMNNLALAYQAAWQLNKALTLLEETLAKYKAKLGPDHPYTLTSMNNLARAYQAVGQRAKALPLYEETLAKRKAKLGPDHPDTLHSMNNLATAYQDAGQMDKALPLLEETLARRKAKLGPDHPDTLTTMNNLAMAYQATGQLNKALPLLEETLAKTKAKLGPDHPDTLISMGNLAGAYLAAKEPEKALPLLRSFLAGQKKQLGGANPRLAGLQAAVALALLKAGQPAAAEPVLRDCLAICEKKLPDSWLTFNTQSMLGGALLGQKKYKEAEPLLLKGYEGMKERQARTPGANAPGSPFQQRLTEAIERLVQLYDATGQAEQAARWRKERERVMGREKKDAR